MTTSVRPPRSGPQAGARRPGLLLSAEWIKFRTVRGWIIGMLLAPLLIVGIALLNHSTCGGIVTSGQTTSQGGCAAPPNGTGRRGGNRQFLLRAPAAGR